MILLFSKLEAEINYNLLYYNEIRDICECHILGLCCIHMLGLTHSESKWERIILLKRSPYGIWKEFYSLLRGVRE
jgi:hypothetical protein